jgi:hypothetical protein
MSYIDQTLLLAYQQRSAVEQERFASNFGLRAAIMQDTPKLPFLTPDLRAHLNTVQTRDTRIPAIKKGSITVATAESFNIPINPAETAYSGVTMITMFAGFGIFPEDYVNNQVGVDVIKMNRIRECDEALALALEAYINTHFNTYKTDVWSGADAADGYSFTDGNVLEVSKAAQGDTMFAHLRTLAAVNNWNADAAYMVANHSMGVVVNEIAKYGAANDKNLQFQVLPSLYMSNRVTNSTDARWSAYYIENGSVGIVPNYKLPFRINKTVGEAKWGISDMAMPMLGDKVMLYEEIEKASSDNGPMSWVEKYAYVYSFFLLKKYNSSTTTQVGNILKIDGLKA